MLVQTLLFTAVSVVKAASLDDLSQRLLEISSQLFPDFAQIGSRIHASPEQATEEFFAHDLITSYFSHKNSCLFEVTRHAYGFPTAFKMEFEHNPSHSLETLPTLAFLCEYDALPGIGHACGHNHITTVCLSAATLTRQALIDYNIPGRVVVYGTFDEEDRAGKKRLLDAGAFQDENSVFMLAHPSTISAVHPMGSRLNVVLAIREDSHALAVENAYRQLVIAQDLASVLPGHSSSISTQVNVGKYATNVVKTNVELGVKGMPLKMVNDTILSVLDQGSTFSQERWVIYNDKDGVSISFAGSGGHAAEGSSSTPLQFSVEVFRALEAQSQQLSYYLPSNTSHLELDITVNMRTRYTSELERLKNFVVDALNNGIPDSMSFDTPYLSLEAHEDLGNLFLRVMNNETNFADPNDIWRSIDVAPAATDAAYIQNPVVDPQTFDLLAVDRVVFHPSYRICQPGVSSCPFNHQPAFADLANTPYSYQQSEKVARGLAYLSIQLANDPELMSRIQAIAAH